jgi:hypothetical protein
MISADIQRPWQIERAEREAERVKTVQTALSYAGRILSNLPRSLSYDRYVDHEIVTTIDVGSYDPSLGTLIERRVFDYALKSYWEVSSMGKMVEVPRTEIFGVNLHQQVKLAVQNMKGDEVESDRTKERTEPLGRGFWSSYWHSGTHRTMGFYESQIHPEVSTTVLLQLLTSSASRAGKDLRIVDLFGGDGKFVDGLRFRLRNALDGAKHYYVVDQNEFALRKARRRLLETDENVRWRVEDEEVFVAPSTDIVKSNTLIPDVSEQVDVVTAMGGLCQEVLQRDEAMEVAAKVSDNLRTGGIFVVTGVSPSLLNSADFRSLGFQVLQMTCPKNLYSSQTHPQQLYVLRKEAKAA